jgi:hypothetical protein
LSDNSVENADGTIDLSGTSLAFPWPFRATATSTIGFAALVLDALLELECPGLAPPAYERSIAAMCRLVVTP